MDTKSFLAFIRDCKSVLEERTANHLSIITELFETPYPVSLVSHTDRLYDYRAVTRTRSVVDIRIEQSEDDNVWSIEFYTDGSLRPTHENDADKVFATVLSAIDDFLKRYKSKNGEYPAALKFEFDTEDPSSLQTRLSVYKNLVKRFAPKYGYVISGEENDTDTITLFLKHR